MRGKRVAVKPAMTGGALLRPSRSGGPVTSANRPYRPDRPAVAELAAGAVLVRAGSDEILLLHHAGEQRWCLPKGHVEAGESIVDAARREVREETGIRRLVLERELAQVSYRFYDPRRDRNVFKTTVYWLARTRERTIRPERLFDDGRWAPPKEARDLLPFPEERRVLDLLRPPPRPAARTRSQAPRSRAGIRRGK